MTGRPIPQPQPYKPAPPPPEVAARFAPPPPSVMAVTQVATDRGTDLAVVFKRTYVYDARGACRLADVQEPLVQEPVPHEALAPDVAPSFKLLPEIVGAKPGTDVVVQGSARPGRPTTTMDVAVQIGAHRHAIAVSGTRRAEFSQGRLVFTPPEPFVEMPLRYENAYGGRDRAAEKLFVDEMRRKATPDELRATGAVLDFLVGGIHPLMYPRNRFGKGYVLDERRESIQGRELPNLELPDDLLTPERLVLRHPLSWSQQPLPAGFDLLDAYSFPRCAMLGLPPAAIDDLGQVPEVKRQWIPRDYCRGNAATASAEELPDILHPSGSRCASLGLWLPWLRGDEELRLEGMDPAEPILRFALPGERPVMRVEHIDRASLDLEEIQLHLVLFRVPERTLSLVWVGRAPLARLLTPADRAPVTAGVRIEMKRL